MPAVSSSSGRPSRPKSKEGFKLSKTLSKMSRSVLKTSKELYAELPRVAVDPSYTWLVAGLLFCLEILLNVFIILRVNYRKFSEEYVGRLQLVERAAATNYFTKNPHLENEEIQDTTNSERPDSATTCITDAVTDLQHRMSKLEDHLGSIKDLLEQRLPKT